MALGAALAVGLPTALYGSIPVVPLKVLSWLLGTGLGAWVALASEKAAAGEAPATLEIPLASPPPAPSPADERRTSSLHLANMSHEIWTPVNGVLGMARMLLTTELSPD